MTAELWLLNPCSIHGAEDCWNTRPEALCRGPLWKRLDPERVVFQATWETRDLTVQDVLDALEEE